MGGAAAKQTAIEDTYREVKRAAGKIGHQTTVCAVAVPAAVDFHGRNTIGDDGRSVGTSSDAASHFVIVSSDVAGGAEVLDGGIHDITEGGAKLFRRVGGEGQCVAVAVEGALESIITAIGSINAHHAVHADVVSQLEILAAVGLA